MVKSVAVNSWSPFESNVTIVCVLRRGKDDVEGGESIVVESFIHISILNEIGLGCRGGQHPYQGTQDFQCMGHVDGSRLGCPIRVSPAIKRGKATLWQGSFLRELPIGECPLCGTGAMSGMEAQRAYAPNKGNLGCVPCVPSIWRRAYARKWMA